MTDMTPTRAMYRPARCPCNDCERKRDRHLKERPAKDVEAAKLRAYRAKRNENLDER